MGLDAAVIRHYEKSRTGKQEGKAQYLNSLLNQFLFYRCKDLRYTGWRANVLWRTCADLQCRNRKIHWKRHEHCPGDSRWRFVWHHVGWPNEQSFSGLRIKDFIAGEVYTFKESLHGRGKTVEILLTVRIQDFWKPTGSLWVRLPYLFKIIPSCVCLLKRWLCFVLSKTNPNLNLSIHIRLVLKSTGHPEPQIQKGERGNLTFK